MRIRGEWFIVWVLSISLMKQWSISDATESDTLRNILVSLSPDVQETKRLDVVLTLKSLLSSTSATLIKSTGLKISETVTILIPDSWDADSEIWKNNEIDIVPHSSAFEKPSNAHITVDASKIFTEPTAIQYGKCGVKGLHVILPEDFLLGEADDNIKAKLLAREWIKYKYGVFDENGFPGDTRFPEYYKIPGTDESDVRISDCSDVPVNYIFQNEDGNNCSLHVNEASGLPVENPTCFVRVSTENNEGVSSSLICKELQLLSNVNKLCDNEQHPHNRNAPNKQNVLCNGKSIWEILKQHKDFQKFRGEFNAEDTSNINFRFIKQSKLRVMVAVDDTAGLANQQDLLKQSIDMLVYTLPDESEFSLSKFKATVSETIQPTLMSNSLQIRNDMTVKIKFMFRDPVNANSTLAIQEAVQKLVPGDTLQPGIIVIVSSVPPEQDIDASLENKLTSLCLVAIVFNEATADGFRLFLNNYNFDSTCTKIFQVTNENTIPALKQLYEAFDFIINQDPSRTPNILVKETELTSEFPLTFFSDKTNSAYDLWLSTTAMRMNVDEGDFTFTRFDEEQAIEETPLPNTGLMLFRISESDASKWTCKLNVPNVQLLAKVIAKPINEAYKLAVNIWIKEEQDDKTNENQPPVILYAKVTFGLYPILNAHVEVEVMHPDNNEATILELLDNGFGDPDITRNDGIYSRYFTQFSKVGEYKLLMSVDDNDNKATIGSETSAASCCGSEIKYTREQPTDLFKRTADAKFFSVHNKPENGYEPSQIQDLKVTQVLGTFVYQLQWTAPGDEKDDGTAKEYILNVLKSWKDAYSYSASKEERIESSDLENFTPPSPYGTIEIVDLHLNESIEDNATYYIALRTVSHGGKFSKISNLVEIFIPDLSNGTDEEIEQTTPGTNLKSISFDGQAIGIAIGSLVGIVCLLVCGYIAFYCFHKIKRRKEDEENKAEIRSPDTPKQNNEADGSVAANEWELDKDPISPVNSVPAKVLLYHHEQVKDAKMKHKDPPLFTLEKLQQDEKQIDNNATANGTKPHMNEENLDDKNEVLQSEIPQNEAFNDINPSNNKQHIKTPLRRITNV